MRMGRRRQQHADASTTERTLAEARSRGYFAVPCEAWKLAGGSFLKTDLLGFADVLAMSQTDCILIQTTTGSHHADRKGKILTVRAENAWHWLAPGRRIEVWSWSQPAKPINGCRWKLKDEPITRQSLLEAGYVPPETQHTLILEPMDPTDEKLDVCCDPPRPHLVVVGGGRPRAPRRARPKSGKAPRRN